MYEPYINSNTVKVAGTDFTMWSSPEIIFATTQRNRISSTSTSPMHSVTIGAMNLPIVPANSPGRNLPRTPVTTAGRPSPAKRERIKLTIVAPLATFALALPRVVQIEREREKGNHQCHFSGPGSAAGLAYAFHGTRGPLNL